jgi:hypothetical protein
MRNSLFLLSLQIKERTLWINAVSVTKTETLLPLDPIVFTPTTFRHTKRLPIRISRPSHKKFHFKIPGRPMAILLGIPEISLISPH